MVPLLVIATRPLNLTICHRVQGSNGGQGRCERGAAMSTRRGDAHAREGCRLQPPTRVALQPQAAIYLRRILDQVSVLEPRPSVVEDLATELQRPRAVEGEVPLVQQRVLMIPPELPHLVTIGLGRKPHLHGRSRWRCGGVSAGVQRHRSPEQPRGLLERGGGVAGCCDPGRFDHAAPLPVSRSRPTHRRKAAPDRGPACASPRAAIRREASAVSSPRRLALRPKRPWESVQSRSPREHSRSPLSRR